MGAGTAEGVRGRLQLPFMKVREDAEGRPVERNRRSPCIPCGQRRLTDTGYFERNPEGLNVIDLGTLSLEL
jgi:hypothetical protein